MSAPTPPWRSDLYGLLPHPDRSRLLLLPAGDGWTLPHAQLDRPIWLDKLGIVSDALGVVLGTGVHAYRYVTYARDKDRHQEAGAYLLEAATSPGPPAGGRWVARHEPPDLALQEPAQRAALDDAFRELAGELPPARRAPWARSGWFAGADAWMRAELAARGLAVVGPIEQVRNWSLSCVLRARTDGGAVYFKAAAAAALFADEPRILAALAARYPAHLPAPLARDAARRWMLLADFGPALGWGAPPADYATMLQAFGRLQLATAGEEAWLLASGCVDRRLDRLATQLPELLADAAFLALLPDEDAVRLRAAEPWLAARCVELAAYGLPPALLHNDLHGGNVALHDGTPHFFDWTDAGVGHPFFDLLILVAGDDETKEAPLRDVYLALWSAFGSPERLRAAWTLVRALGALHHVVSYRALLGSLEPRCRHELADDATFWLRRLLAELPTAP